MQEVDSTHAKSQRRRTERVSISLPLTVRGIDLLGQPFEERTSTQVINVHGCRYASKHHLPKNAWVTLEFWDGSQARHVRARIAWVERPQSIRDFFQTGVELDTPGNIWVLANPPESWSAEAQPAPSAHTSMGEPAVPGGFAPNPLPFVIGTIEANAMDHPGNEYRTFTSETADATPEPNPLLRDLTSEIQRQAKQAIEAAATEASEAIRQAAAEDQQRRIATAEEFFQTWKENWERTQSEAHEGLSAQLSAKQEEFLNGLKLQFEERFTEARQVLQDLDQQTRLAHDTEAVLRESNRLEQDASEHQPKTAHETTPVDARWNERLELELALAQSQWNELLQSSLDQGIHRLAQQLSERSQEVLRNAEERIANRFVELRQPLAETSAEARDALSSLRSDLEREMTHARSSLVEIEHVASRLKEYSAQLEASSHDTLNELHRRLENILDGHTQEMNRHAERLLSGMSERIIPTIDALGSELVENTISEVESKLAPHLERVPDLIRDLSSHEIQVEESLRLHRERLRQLSDNNHRDVAAQMASTVAALRGDFESARQDALTKWSEELNASGVRASHAASESIGQASEWFQNEARARLQVIVEQTLESAKGNCESLASEAAQKSAGDASKRTAEHFVDAQRQLEASGNDVAARTQSQLEEAAQAAAASFGQVLQGISGKEIENFTHASRTVIQERAQDLDRASQEALGNFSSSAESALGGLRTQLASEVENSVAQGRDKLSAELAIIMERLAAERATREQEWTQGLERLSEQASGKHQDRLENACDAWLVSSVRRLNEHGQNVIESLMRLSDQALRESCSKVFEGLAEMMRNRATDNPNSFPGFAQASGREIVENPPTQ